MIRLPIFTETKDGELVPMRPSAPPDEGSLQDLIGRFPEVISGDGEPLLLVRREKSVPDAMDGSARWSLDHLFVSRSAVPVLVEVKRASDTRIRREVVGQLMDYAANGVAYWQPGTLVSAFEQQCAQDNEDPNLVLSQFLRDEDPADFWDQVDANLSAGRIRMVIAADAIPKELARIVEFLNEQMRCTVLAVELTYFVSEDGRRTLAPKVVGETERTEQVKSTGRKKLEPISMDDWIAKHLAPRGNGVLSASHTYLETVKALGAEIAVASTQGSIVTSWITEDKGKTYPVFLTSAARVAIGFGWVSSRPALRDETIRGEFLSRVDSVVGGLSTQNVNGHPSFPVDQLNDPQTLSQFQSILGELVTLARKGAG